MACIVAYDGSENVTECVSHALCRVERYGFREADWQIRNLRHEKAYALGSLARRRIVGRAGDATWPASTTR